MAEYGGAIRQRAKMAMGGGGDGGGAGVPHYPGRGSKPNPNHASKVGEDEGGLGDGERGIGHPIHHSKDHHPAQAAPDHGPMHLKELGFDHGDSNGA
jgi:hypothetical protein